MIYIYIQEQIELLAEERILSRLAHLSEKQLGPIEFRVATSDDAFGIYRVLASFGWPATPPALRQTWYQTNDQLDFVVVQYRLIMGYVSLVPSKPEAMEDMVSGRKKSWQMKATDILPFESGKHYDLFTGIAVRDIAHRAAYTTKLVYGMRRQITIWRQSGIMIDRLLAHSAEKEGQQLAVLLGFREDQAQPGDLYPRFILDFAQPPVPYHERKRKASEIKHHGLHL